jgi:hypothetical protein
MDRTFAKAGEATELAPANILYEPLGACDPSGKTPGARLTLQFQLDRRASMSYVSFRNFLIALSAGAMGALASFSVASAPLPAPAVDMSASTVK